MERGRRQPWVGTHGFEGFWPGFGAFGPKMGPFGPDRLAAIDFGPKSPFLGFLGLFGLKSIESRLFGVFEAKALFWGQKVVVQYYDRFLVF